MTAFVQDLKFALRRLRKAPLFTLFAVVTLALAIGIVTAVYSLIRTGLRPELGLDDPDRLVLLTAASLRNPISSPDFEDIAAQTRTLESVSAWTTFTSAMVARGLSEFAAGELVSGTFFRTVGLRPIRGRLIEPADDQPGAPLVVVLSASAWRSRLGRDPSALGSTVRIAGHAFEVIGIVPESFKGLRPRGINQPDVWLPLSAAPRLTSRPSRQDPNRRDHQWLSVVGRLAPERTTADAATELRLTGDRIDAAAPLADLVLQGGTRMKQTRAWTARGAEDSVNLGEARDVLRAVLLLPTLVLIVACTNLANFALSRGVARQNEFGVRLAIGASRWQLIRGQLVEHALVAAMGGVGALVVADRLLALVAVTVRGLFGDMPQYRVDARIAGDVLLVVGGAALLSVVVAGLIPALQLTRRNLSQAMGGQAATALPRWRGRSNLIALQVGLSVALLLVAALCVRQLPKLDEHVRSGRSLDRVALVSVPFAQQAILEVAARQTIDSFLGALHALPGVTAASASSDRQYSELVEVAADGGATAPPGAHVPTSQLISVSASYFQTVGLDLVAGRPFNDRDTAGAERVVILNESQARSLFRTVSVVGRRLFVDSDFAGAVATFTIVGIAADTRSGSATRDNVETTLYVPLAQRFEELVPIAIQARAADGVSPVALARNMRDTLRRMNPEVAVAFTGSADGRNFGPGVVLRYFVWAFGTLAFLALGFAMSGLYGVLTHVVGRRTRELGVRAALGADPTRIVRLVLRDGSRPVLEGIVLGFGLAVGARMGMQPWFTEPITAVDPVALVIAIIPLIVAAGLACYLPARRAARVDPNVALRHL